MSGFNQNVDLDIGALLKEAWELFTKDVVTWIIAGLVILAAAAALLAGA